MQGDRYYQIAFEQYPGDERHMPGVIRILVNSTTGDTLMQAVKRVARDEKVLPTAVIRESDGRRIKVDGLVFRR